MLSCLLGQCLGNSTSLPFMQGEQCLTLTPRINSENRNHAFWVVVAVQTDVHSHLWPLCKGFNCVTLPPIASQREQATYFLSQSSSAIDELSILVSGRSHLCRFAFCIGFAMPNNYAGGISTQDKKRVICGELGPWELHTDSTKLAILHQAFRSIVHIILSAREQWSEKATRVKIRQMMKLRGRA